MALSPEQVGPARESLLGFTEATSRLYRADPFHVALAHALDRVLSGELRRLIVTAPPQHGKSELMSVRFPAYALGRDPRHRVMVTSYAAELAQAKSREVRDIIQSEPYQQLFPNIELRQDSRAVNRWQLKEYPGGMIAAGVGGPIVGWGCTIGVIDDPIENQEAAMSAVIREKQWEWYRAVFRTRVWEGGAIIVLMTRWHEDDLAGRLLESQPGQWEVLRFSAIGETQEERDEKNRLIHLSPGLPDPAGRAPGEALAPSRYSAEEIGRIRDDVGEQVYSSQYDGIPRPAEGALFKRAWAHEFTVVEDFYSLDDGREFPIRAVAIFAVADLAFSEKKTADWSVISIWGVTPDMDLLLLAVERFRRGDEADMIDEMWSVQHDWQHDFLAIETNGFSLKVIEKAKKSGLLIRECVADKDKVARAMPAVLIMRGGQFFMRRGAAWRELWDGELFAFPYATNDDQVDTFSIAAQMRQEKPRRAKRQEAEKLPIIRTNGGGSAWR